VNTRPLPPERAALADDDALSQRAGIQSVEVGFDLLSALAAAPAALMLRDSDGTAGDVCTLDANKDAAGSGLQLSGVARRANPTGAGNHASLDSDGDPTNSGYAANLLTGALPVAGAAVTGTYAATIGGCFIEADSTAGDVTVTLPIGTAIPDGKVYHIKKIVAANNLIVVPEATEVAGSVRIDGATSQTTAIQWATLSVIRNGGQWRMI
jgi:hypothetical protein